MSYAQNRMRSSLLITVALLMACRGKISGESHTEIDDTETADSDDTVTPDDTHDTDHTDDTDDTDDTGEETDNRTPKVLTIMVDGWKPEVIATSTTPTIDAMLSTAAYSLKARVEDTTISGSGQTTFLTGVHRDKHQVPDNNFYDPNMVEYPHHFTRVMSALPDALTASYTTWSPIPDYIVSDADINVFADYDEDGDAIVLDALLEDLAESDLDVISLMLSDLDVVGHAYQFDEYGTEYIAEMEDIDAQIGAVIAAIEARETWDEENWLVIISTDHAGTEYGHGYNIPEHRLVPLVVYGDSAAPGVIWPAPDAVDIVPTLLEHLGIESDAAWGLDGRSVGLEATAAPDAALGTNLVINGDAEYERGYDDYEPDAAVPGWTDTDYATVLLYDSPDGFPTSSDPGPKDRGHNFFCGGGTGDDTELTQTINLSAIATEIAAGTTFTFSAYLGGYSSQNDRAAVTVAFSDSDGSALYSETIGPVTADDRGDATGLLEQTATGDVPTSAAFATVTISAIISYGYNDGYADNISLIIDAK